MKISTLLLSSMFVSSLTVSAQEKTPQPKKRSKKEKSKTPELNQEPKKDSITYRTKSQQTDYKYCPACGKG